MFILFGIWLWLSVGTFLAMLKFSDDDEVTGVNLRRIVICPPWYFAC